MPDLRRAAAADRDIAAIKALPCGLDPGDDPASACPGSSTVPGLGKAAHHLLIAKGPLGANSIGDVLHLLGERLGAGQAEDVGDAVGLTPRHDLGAGVVAVAPEGESGRRPMSSNAPDQTAEMAADLDPAGGLAGTEDHRNRAGTFGIVNMALGLVGGERQPRDRQEAAFVVEGVEQGHLLLAMNHIAAVIDIQHHRLRRLGIACTPLVDQGTGEAHDIPQARGILQA